MNEICLSCRKHTKCGRAIHETIGCGYYVPMTEQEYLQTCDTEQLAEKILEMCEYKPCFACGIGHCDDENWCHVYSDEAREFVVAWLKQPHREE